MSRALRAVAVVALAAVACAVTTTAYAGRTCEQRPPTALAVTRARRR